jgi:hypothetical protein
MLELDVTHMVEDADNMPNLSGSIAELGQDAGKITWNNSMAYAASNAHTLLKTDDDRDQARDYFAGFGAWSKEEIAAWSDAELEALTVQYIAGGIREMEAYDSDEAYLEAAREGRCGSCELYKGDDERWYVLLSD